MCPLLFISSIYCSVNSGKRASASSIFRKLRLCAPALGFCIALDIDFLFVFRYDTLSYMKFIVSICLALILSYSFVKATDQDNQQRLEAVEQLIVLAESGDAKAQYELANYYFNTSDKEGNAKKAFDWMKRSAEQGNADAQCELGFYYESGMGTDIDTEKALSYYQKSAAQNDGTAGQRIHLLELPLSPETPPVLPDNFKVSRELERYYMALLISFYEKSADKLEKQRKFTTLNKQYTESEVRYFLPMIDLPQSYSAYMKNWRDEADIMMEAFVTAKDNDSAWKAWNTGMESLEAVNARYPDIANILSYSAAKQYVNQKYSMDVRMKNLKLITLALGTKHPNYIEYQVDHLRGVASILRLRFKLGTNGNPFSK